MSTCGCDPLLTYKELADVSKSSIRSLQRAVKRPGPDFPRPVRVGARGVRFRQSEVSRWLANLPAVAK